MQSEEIEKQILISGQGGEDLSLTYKENNIKRIADNTLVAITLLIAESKPEEKDIIVKVIVNLINQRN